MEKAQYNFFICHIVWEVSRPVITYIFHSRSRVGVLPSFFHSHFVAFARLQRGNEWLQQWSQAPFYTPFSLIQCWKAPAHSHRRILMHIQSNYLSIQYQQLTLYGCDVLNKEDFSLKENNSWRNRDVERKAVKCKIPIFGYSFHIKDFILQKM